MSHILSPLSQSSFLQNCFVIFDSNSVGEESAAEDGVPADSKFFFNGWCTAMLNFTKNFTNHPLEVATLEKFKVAFKQVGSTSMALTGTVDQPDSTILSHLELIYSAFRFYNRSFAAVLQANQSKKELLQKMEQIGKLLEPLITRNFHMNVMRAFNPIPYTPLPHKANRHFIQASQLLNFVKMKPGNLSGCVLYKRSVVCTHLDFTTTRWILNWIDFNKSSRNFSSQSSFNNVPGRGRADPTYDFVPVYMFRDDIDRLIRERENMFPFTNIQSSSYNVGSPFAAPIFKPTVVDDDTEDLDGFAGLGLCIVSVHELSVAVLMTFKAFANENHIKRSFGIQMLESDLEGTYSGSPVTTMTMTMSLSGSGGGSGGGGGGGGGAGGGVGMGMGMGMGMGNSGGGGGGGKSGQQPSGPLLAFNSRVLPSASYSLLAYDSLTHSASITPLNTPQDDFILSASLMHHAFLQDPSISQIICKDHNGEIFGKQVFGREVYYQLKNNSNMSHDRFLEIIEKTVRSTLKEEHNINLI